MVARGLGMWIVMLLVGACADPTPPARTELNSRMPSVRAEIWANETLLSADDVEQHLPQLEATIQNIIKRHGQRSVAAVQSLTETGRMLVYGPGRYDLAIPFIQRSLDVSREVYGSEHRETAYALHDLAVVYAGADLSRYGAEAETALREAIDIRRKLLGPDHEELAGAETELARELLGRWSEGSSNGPILEAESLASHARTILEPLRGPTHYEIVSLRRVLLECAIVRKEYSLAEARAREAIRYADEPPSNGRFPDVSAEQLLRTRITVPTGGT